MTAADILAFIKAFPKFVDFLKIAYGDFIKMQIKNAESEANKKINDLSIEIAKLKGAVTNEEIRAEIIKLNQR